MAHVTLDGSGNITGMYARPQPNVPGYAEIPRGPGNCGRMQDS
jgi:hypothetical protein